MRRIAKVLLAGVLMVGVVGGVVATSATTAQAARTWNCWGGSDDASDDKGGRNVHAGCEKIGALDDVTAQFYAYGDSLRIGDNFPNGRKTQVTLTVEGYGTSTYYYNGSVPNTPNFPEGRDVWIKVCTSKSSGAVCSKAYGGGRT